MQTPKSKKEVKKHHDHQSDQVQLTKVEAEDAIRAEISDANKGSFIVRTLAASGLSSGGFLRSHYCTIELTGAGMKDSRRTNVTSEDDPSFISDVEEIERFDVYHRASTVTFTVWCTILRGGSIRGNSVSGAVSSKAATEWSTGVHPIPILMHVHARGHSTPTHHHLHAHSLIPKPGGGGRVASHEGDHQVGGKEDVLDRGAKGQGDGDLGQPLHIC